MTETERIDEGFMYLFDRLGTPANDRDNPDSTGEKALDVRRILTQIYEIGFADRTENIQRTMGNNRVIYDYWLNSKAVHFIDTLPKEYKKRPYSYYLKLEEVEKILKKQRDDLDEKLKRISVGNIKLNKWLPLIAIFISGLSVYATIAYKNNHYCPTKNFK